MSVQSLFLFTFSDFQPYYQPEGDIFHCQAHARIFYFPKCYRHIGKGVEPSEVVGKGVLPQTSAFKRLETAARPTPSRRAASAGLFPSRINCKSVSSLIFFFAMETSWKHYGNFWFIAVIARLSLKMSATNILRSTTHGNTWKLPGNIMEKYGNFWETVSICWKPRISRRGIAATKAGPRSEGKDFLDTDGHG